MNLPVELRFALRALRRAPGFTITALLTLGVGIGSVTALFSVLYAFTLRPLPYKDAGRIVALQELRLGNGARMLAVSIEAAYAVIQGTRSFERATLYQKGYAQVSIGDRQIPLEVLRIDSSFAQLFDVRPQIGRPLSAQEIEGDAPSVMISALLWRTRFGADPAMIGRTIQVGDDRLTVVGIMPEGFRFPDRVDFWRPLRIVDTADAAVTFLGKLRPGITDRGLRTELSLVARRLSQSDSQRFSGMQLIPREMLDRKGDAALPIASLFVGAAFFVLLIACANVANLLLVRAADQRREMAVRASLGASHARLLRQAFTESVILAGGAGILGTLLSLLLVRIGLSVIPTVGFPSWVSFGLDLRILLFTIALTSLVTVAVGIVPAREGTRFNLAYALKTGGDGLTPTSGVAVHARIGIVLQLALSVTLFVGTSLFVQTYRRLVIVDIGYPAAEIVAAEAHFDPKRYANDTSRMHFALELVDAIRAHPGVHGVAVRGMLNAKSLAPATPTQSIESKNRAEARPNRRLLADADSTATRRLETVAYPPPRYFVVSHSYFQTLGLRLLRGRTFGPSDKASSVKVSVVSRRFAESVWSRTDPIGRTIQFGSDGARVTIIGVVEDVRDIQGGRRGIFVDPRADAYFSSDQLLPGSPAVLIRASATEALQSATQKMARRIDPNILLTTSTMAREVEAELFVVRVFGFLMGGFAVAGLVLSIIGIYGVVAYGITQRTREIGIRIALGGTRQDVVRHILRESSQFVGFGLVVGIALSVGTGRLLRGLLFGVSTTAPLVYGLACSVFGAVALIACYLPTRRVATVDPLSALRSE